MGIYGLLDGISCGLLVGAFVVSGESKGRYEHVGHHEHDQDPSDDFSEFHRDFFNPARNDRIEFFEPDDGGYSPEETVQEVDTASEVEGNVAVVPEDFSEYDFGEHTADVFVGSAEEGTKGKQESIGAVAVVVEEPGSEGDGQALDDAERAPYKAAAAHPDTGGDATEYGFCNIAQKCADDEEKNDFVKAASFGKYAGFCFLFFLRNWLYGRIGTFHTTLQIAVNTDRKASGEGVDLIVHSADPRHFFRDVVQNSIGTDGIYYQYTKENPGCDMQETGRN